jgi:hypothetical protein
MNRSEAISLFRSSRSSLSHARAREPGLAALVERAATIARSVKLEQLRALLSSAHASEISNIDLRTVLSGALSNVLRDRITDFIRRGVVPSPPNSISLPTPPRSAPQPAALSQTDVATLRDATSFLGNMEDPLPSDDTRLEDIPFLRPGIDLGRFYVLADAVKISPERAEELSKTLPSPEAATDQVLTVLVEKQILKSDEARTLGAARVAFLLSDDSEALTCTVAGKHIGDLLGMRPQAWAKALKASKAPVPDGYDASSWAFELARRHAALAPSKALHGRLLGAVDDDDAPVERIAAAWPGFKLDAVLADPNLSPTDRRAALKLPLTVVAKLHKAYPEVDWLSLDYNRGSTDVHELKLEAHFTADEQRMLLGSLKAQQRVHAISADVDASIRLLEGGYHSAAAIALVRVPKLVADTGLAQDEAERVHFSATEMLGITSNMAMGVHDVVRGLFSKLPVGNLSSDARDYLAKIGGYAELFGTQGWCDCKHCNSILSPSAYFVDLMSYVDEHIREGLFTQRVPLHPLDLHKRRPDLLTLPLTCKNTETLEPTLDVINEILENFVAQETGFGPDLADRVALRKHVYRQQMYARRDVNGGRGREDLRAFDQPFCLPYERVGRLLAQAGRTRADVAAVVGGDTIAQQLVLSPEERRITFTEDTDLTRLSKLFKGIISSSGPIDRVEVPEFLSATGLSRDELGDLISAWFIRGSDSPRIQAEKLNDNSVQNDVERLHGLTAGVLDRIHRFVRLARGAGLSFPELDLWMRERGLLKLDGPPSDAASAGEQIARLLAVRATLGLDIEDTLALCGPLPTQAINADGKSLPARRFNAAPYVGLGGTLPQPNTRFNHPELGAVTTIADPMTPRLCAGVGVNEEDLSRLIRALQKPLSDTSGAALADSTKGFPLSAENLALLYRHARLARALRLRIDQLFQLLTIVNESSPWVRGLDGLEAVLDFFATWREGKRTLDAIGIATAGPVLDPTARLSVKAVLTEVWSEPPDTFRFSDTVFATALGISASLSRSIVAKNAPRFEALDDGWRLRSDFSFATALTAPDGVVEQALRGVLREYHAPTVLAGILARVLKIDSAKAAGLLAVAGVNAEAPGTVLVSAVRGDKKTDVLHVLLDLVLRLHALFAPPEIDGEALTFIAGNLKMFALDQLPTIRVAAVWAVDRYARLTRAPSVAFGETQTMFSRDALHALLRTHGSKGFPPGQDAALAQALRAQLGIASTVRAAIPAADTAIGTLQRLSRAIELARDLGVTGDTLPLLLSEDYDKLAQGADALVVGLRLRYPDEATANAQLEPLEDALRNRSRDALCSYILRFLAPAAGIPWRNRNDLYHYFLIDVDMGGCGRTSRLVSAISSLQLYVHRVRMNLEQDQREDGEQKVRVQLSTEAADEWIWRRNYRVWEANRKVFLWPENYLEPDLRDDKTDQFVELESTLLQQEINEQTVLDAYTSYLAGFEEVATLRIGGAWYEATGSVDRLHLFGATSSDPPIWYYRSIDNLRFSRREQPIGVKWGNWVKLTVQIPVREVAPVIFKGRLHVFWVELRTKVVNSKVESGTSEFLGYDHIMRLKFTTLRADGTWSAPQEVSLGGWPYPEMSAGLIQDRLVEKSREEIGGETTIHKGPRLTDQVHTEPRDDYTISGAPWDRVIPEVLGDNLHINGRNYGLQAVVDLFGRRLLSATSAPDTFLSGPFTPFLANIPSLRSDPLPLRRLYIVTVPRGLGPWNSGAAILLDEDWIQSAEREGIYGGELLTPRSHLYSEPPTALVPSNAELHAIPRQSGPREDAIIQVDQDVLLLHGSAEDGPSARLVRLSTTLAKAVSRTLFNEGIEAILGLEFQIALNEERLPVMNPSNLLKNDEGLTGTAGAKATLRGPMGAWYQELFFHIPWRIALHLNAQGRYEAAQRWFHYIFDPTASDTSGPDRVWRYVAFRDFDIPTLRAILGDEVAIRAYTDDPFNPHAIARLRPSAYQKHIVMRYVDNLLDWADSLFTEFTTESVAEAVLLYVLASDILGERPARLGPCGEAIPTTGNGPPAARTYEQIKPLLDQGSEFLMELQSWSYSKSRLRKSASAVGVYGADVTFIATAKDSARKMKKREPAFRGPGSPEIRGGAWRSSDGGDAGDTGTRYNGRGEPSRAGARIERNDKGTGARTISKKQIAANRDLLRFGGADGRFGWTILRQISPVFCVPPNKELLVYWDRVEDRLGKIRTCRDIDGVPRVPPLFAPEIDPRLLVRAQALGLSLDDVLGGTAGSLPPYRFLYLIEKAKAMASTVASFGSALLSALEKKDVEQLNRLRLVQQQNIAKATTNLRRWDVEVAGEALAAVERQIEAATYRKEYYAGLGQGGRSVWEYTQSTGTHASSIILGTAATQEFLAGVLHLIPQLGSPFAMKYGGRELGSGAARVALGIETLAAVSQAVAASAGLEAGFERRADGWDHQKKLAEHELKQLDHQKNIAKLRFDIAKRALEIHEESVSQIEEMFTFYDGKFTGLGLYTWLATMLQRVYRGAYNNALSLARLADEAFRYERSTTDVIIGASYWSASYAGLASGEQLLLALQSLERRFIETNHRSHEVDQAFSLQQVAPQAIVTLRETGTCRFKIPELFFDLAYPGHYRRRIKAVRLTIPCVTGPYVNISAVLTLTDSEIRRDADLDAALTPSPTARTISVAASTAQNDAGVFELSFRDERYMPFEGAGAISSWKLDLPHPFRAFDYGSLNDVILSISYTAEYDESLRAKLQKGLGEVEAKLVKVLEETPVTRLFSLKHDFATAFNRVLHSAAGTAVTFEISDVQLPFFLTGRRLNVTSAILGLELEKGASFTGLSLVVDGSQISIDPQTDLANLPGATLDLDSAFSRSLRGQHSITVRDGGNLRPASALPGDPSPLDDALVKDIVIYVTFMVAR